MDSHQEEHPQSFFTRTDNIKGSKNSPIHQEAKNLYRELSTAPGVQKQGPACSTHTDFAK
jgi:hypothetical protein